MTAQAIIDAISPELNDDARDRWSVATLVKFINDAQDTIVLRQPEANSVRAAFQLTAGAFEHAAPSGTFRVLDVTHNLGADGVTIGRSIDLVPRETLDAFRPNWRKETGQTEIKNWMFNDKLPTRFEVYPRAHATTAVHVALERSVKPTDCVDANSPLGLPDLYRPAIQQWVLYRAFSVNSSTASLQRAQQHLLAWGALLGLKIKADVAFSPNQQGEKK